MFISWNKRFRIVAKIIKYRIHIQTIFAHVMVLFLPLNASFPTEMQEEEEGEEGEGEGL